MKNWYLILFLFLFSCKTVILTHTNLPIWECDFTQPNSLEKWEIKNNTRYNTTNTLFMANKVRQTPEGLFIECTKESGVANTWQGIWNYDFIGGQLQTWDDDFDGVSFTGECVVEIYCKVPKSWAAFWTLYQRRFQEKTGRFHSVPELDVVENNGNRNDFWIHFGYYSIDYKQKSIGKIKVHKPDGKFHRYAVKKLKNGYEYYFENKLIKTFKDKPEYNNEFVDLENLFYLILTNAGDLNRFDFDYSEFIIKWIKIYDI